MVLPSIGIMSTFVVFRITRFLVLMYYLSIISSFCMSRLRNHPSISLHPSQTFDDIVIPLHLSFSCHTISNPTPSFPINSYSILFMPLDTMLLLSIPCYSTSFLPHSTRFNLWIRMLCGSIHPSRLVLSNNPQSIRREGYCFFIRHSYPDYVTTHISWYYSLLLWGRSPRTAHTFAPSVPLLFVNSTPHMSLE